MRNKWYSFRHEGETAEISIYDEIGGWGMDSAAFKREFDRVKDASEIRVTLNSPGGSVTDGMAIYNMLSSVRDRVTVEVIGIAASIASVIALAGRETVMGSGTYLMIHDPWTVTAGGAADLRKAAEILDKMRGELASIYAGRSGQDREQILGWMAEETWWTADEAVEHGFADSVADYSAVAARIDPAKYGFSRIPKQIVAGADVPRQQIRTERELERVLRDAGLSREEAKAVVASFRSRQRDAGEENERELVQSINQIISELTR